MKFTKEKNLLKNKITQTQKKKKKKYKMTDRQQN